MNFNKAVIVGNMTRDPEAKTLPSGQPVANFGVATNRVWNDKEGNKQQATEFHNIVAFGKLADICSRYLNKGRLVLIEGRIQTRSWQDQNGNKKYWTEIVAENMQMGPRNDGGSSKQDQEAPMQDRDPDPKGVGEIPVIEADEPTSENEESESKEKVDLKDIPF